MSVLRNVPKVLGKTAQLANNSGNQNLFRAFAVGTTKLSSNNNYSTKVKKENFITVPKQRHNNNKLMLMNTKNYSSSQVLNPVEFEGWSKEVVCSLLCTPKENGGAGLAIADVKPLYDADFKGTSLASIVNHLQSKDIDYAYQKICSNRDYLHISQTTLENVVFWVDNLLKTRLYHLWSYEHVKEQLCNQRGAGLSKYDADLIVGLININDIFNDIKKDDFEKTLSTLEMLYKNHGDHEKLSKALKTVVQWANNCSTLKCSKIPAQVFIGPVQSFGHEIPYQNNESNVLMVGKKLLENINLKENNSNERFQKLIINFAYYGLGKTRFGVEFLDLFKKYLKDKQNKEALITEFGERAVEKLENTELIYIDLSVRGLSYERTLKYLRTFIPTNNSSYFVVFDEYPSFCIKNQENTPLLFKMYLAWVNCIYSIQLLPNVVGVYICGRGAFLDLFDKSLFKDNANNAIRSPTESVRVELHGLSRDNIESIFKETVPKSKAILEQEGLYEFFLDEVLEETAGIPLLVQYVTKHLSTFCPRSKEDTILFFNQFQDVVPERILYPFTGEATFSTEIYTFLMFISQLTTNLDPNMNITTKMFRFDRIYGLQDLKEIDLSTLAVALNCYVTNTNNGHIRIVFPRRTVRKYLPSFSSSFSIEQYVNTIPQFLDKGAIFETLTGSFIIWNSKLGFYGSQKFQNTFPFLTDTILADRPCIELGAMVVSKKCIKSNAEAQWKEVYLNFSAYQNKLTFTKDKAHGPDKFIVLEQDLWWCIQDKNIDKFNFTELFEEISYLEKFPPNVKIVFTILYRCKVDDLKRIHSEGSIIQRPEVTGSGRPATMHYLQVPKNVTLVIVDETEIKNFIGEHNLLALTSLSKSEVKHISNP